MYLLVAHHLDSSAKECHEPVGDDAGLWVSQHLHYSTNKDRCYVSYVFANDFTTQENIYFWDS